MPVVFMEYDDGTAEKDEDGNLVLYGHDENGRVVQLPFLPSEIYHHIGHFYNDRIRRKAIMNPQTFINALAANLRRRRGFQARFFGGWFFRTLQTGPAQTNQQMIHRRMLGSIYFRARLQS